MRLYVVCDNDDTQVGLRLAGIDGKKVSDARDVETAVLKLAQNKDIGIILINRSLMAGCTEFVQSFRKKHSLPLIVEIPDTNGTKGSNSIANFVRDAVGIK